MIKQKKGRANLGKPLRRDVFSWDLNSGTEEDNLICRGRLFQSTGAATEKAQLAQDAHLDFETSFNDLRGKPGVTEQLARQINWQKNSQAFLCDM